MGVGLGTSEYEGDGLDDGASFTSIYGGYIFNDYLSLEGAYVDLGKAKDRILPAGVISLTQDTLRIDANGFTIAPVFNYAITQSFHISAMFGVAALDVDKQWTGGTIVDPTLANDTGGTEINAFGGIRLTYEVAESLAMGVSYQQYDVDGIDVDTAFGVVQIQF
jgi:hypothetical protein